ncbi:hypothetical protein D3C84_918880 [compost metagenome]
MAGGVPATLIAFDTGSNPAAGVIQTGIHAGRSEQIGHMAKASRFSLGAIDIDAELGVVMHL